MAKIRSAGACKRSAATAYFVTVVRCLAAAATAATASTRAGGGLRELSDADAAQDQAKRPNERPNPNGRSTGLSPNHRYVTPGCDPRGRTAMSVIGRLLVKFEK